MKTRPDSGSPSPPHGSPRYHGLNTRSRGLQLDDRLPEAGGGMDDGDGPVDKGYYFPTGLKTLPFEWIDLNLSGRAHSVHMCFRGTCFGASGVIKRVDLAKTEGGVKSVVHEIAAYEALEALDASGRTRAPISALVRVSRRQCMTFTFVHGDLHPRNVAFCEIEGEARRALSVDLKTTRAASEEDIATPSQSSSSGFCPAPPLPLVLPLPACPHAAYFVLGVWCR
ncbi:hypothetical protein BDK51DRAFT_46390 [Blyttiomyces helicus]|uniref:Uncharacterized protein n=1 Tax=Blyttiomyces helicus TaxID=388810 RepID=A0A4P9W7M2_9FUNG|nr:hypothetical protein BDK51DRAFT_46390 [Blyttiomyces helicus]|eukprot:RKO86156.1 hypothetical protein BDK51DRAFT_46390 [Blyttiomyces helicus]